MKMQFGWFEVKFSSYSRFRSIVINVLAQKTFGIIGISYSTGKIGGLIGVGYLE